MAGTPHIQYWVENWHKHISRKEPWGVSWPEVASTSCTSTPCPWSSGHPHSAYLPVLRIKAVSHYFPVPYTGVSGLGALPEPEKLARAPTFTLAEQGDGVHCSISSDSELIPVPTPAAVAQSNSGVVSTNTLSLTVPPKFTRRILQLEYIEMSELIPETWGLESENGSPCCHQGHRQTRWGPVVDTVDRETFTGKKFSPVV